MNKKTTQQVVSYNPSLVATLKSQHQQLMKKYKHILEVSEVQQYLQLNESLKIFSDLITEHLRDERELYMYLEYIVSKNDGTYRNTGTEMKDIAVDIRSVINLHINTPVTEYTVNDFRKDFSLLGKNLLGRMRHEEKHLFNDYTSHNAE